MTPIAALVFLLVAAGGTAVVLTRNPLNQAMVYSAFGLLLTVLFIVLQAPDVALSELAVGSAAVPLIVLIALVKVKGAPE